MAREIRYGVNLAVANGNYSVRFNASGNIDQAVLGAQDGIVIVGTSEEDMPVGDVVTNGVLLLYNLDDTNYVTYGPKSAGSMISYGRLNPGEVHLVRLLSGVTVRWIANTASVKVEMHLFNN